MKQDLRDFHREVAQEFADVRKGITQQFAEHRGETNDLRKEVAQQITDVRRDLRHNLYAMIGVFATITIAFIEYRLPSG